MKRAAPLLACMLVAWCRCAFALNPSLDVSQYAHTSWRIRDGFAKGSIQAIAQTPDGYLCLGTEFGLLRFDGVRTIPWQPPPGRRLRRDNITKLLVARDGTLWIGTLAGLASWKEGKLVQYAQLDGFSIFNLLEDREGVVWVLTSRPSGGGSEGNVCSIRRGDVTCESPELQLGLTVGLYEDRRGNLWVGTSKGLWRWGPGARQFFSLPDIGGIRALTEGEDGTLLITFRGGIQQFSHGRTTPYFRPGVNQQFQSQKLLRDRDDGLWIGTSSRGLVHLHHGRTDIFSTSQGLSGDYVLTIFEDREGSVWVVTTGGLDRFRETAVATLSIEQGLSNDVVTTVLAAHDGSVWLGTSGGLNRWSDGRVSLAPTGSGKRDGRLNGQNPGSLFQDFRGRIWVDTVAGLGYLENGGFAPLNNVPAVNVHAFAEDVKGNVWMADQNRGLFRRDRSGSVELILWSRFLSRGFGLSMTGDPRGGIWIGFVPGGLAYFADDMVRASYSERDGFAAGDVTDLRLDSDGTLWASTQGGLSLLNNGRVTTLNTRDGLPCDTVHWTIEDTAHAVWLATPCGLLRILRAELDAWAAAAEKDPDSKQTIQFTLFDGTDGVRLSSNAFGYSPHAAKASDGMLWFGGLTGAGMIDPGRIPFNKLPPPVQIEQIIADRKAYDTTTGSGAHFSLPALVRDLEIDYTALSLVAPEKNRFRYKLEGFDRDWQNVGNRRQAFYTNLPPRNYRFRVAASNNSGVWNEAGASLDFSIAPAYYQTLWFRLSVVTAFLSLLGALYQLRQRQIVRQFNMRLEERVNERTRIARDLHDTLLQSFHGVLLRFQSAAILLPDRPVDAQKALASGIDQAAEAIAEGRDAVQGLRSSVVTAKDLASVMSAIGEELAADQTGHHPPDLSVRVEGTPRDLGPLTQDEVYRVAREALRNAYQHADATRIVVEVRYDPRQFRLRVRDDGKGMDQKIVDEGGRAGHYGLPGMRERAKLLRGTLTIWSERESGTEVELTIPGSVAYARSFDARPSTVTERI
jgi:signal transduction histidine kinase/ligand-binding sensor domain-containing protein